jgi:hypothetical protein
LDGRLAREGGALVGLGPGLVEQLALWGASGGSGVPLDLGDIHLGAVRVKYDLALGATVVNYTEDCTRLRQSVQ